MEMVPRSLSNIGDVGDLVPWGSDNQMRSSCTSNMAGERELIMEEHFPYRSYFSKAAWWKYRREQVFLQELVVTAKSIV